MTLYLSLFLSFLEIGAVSFGGGYAMIYLIREKALLHGWLTEEALMDMIAVAESTPGPIAVNMATFVGSAEGGFLGALVATLGGVSPSFIILLLIAALMSEFLKYKPVRAVLRGIRPAAVGLVLATAVTMLLRSLFGLSNLKSGGCADLRAIGIFVFLLLFSFLSSRILKKKISPILIILISAGLGMLIY